MTKITIGSYGNDKEKFIYTLLEYSGRTFDECKKIADELEQNAFTFELDDLKLNDFIQKMKSIDADCNCETPIISDTSENDASATAATITSNEQNDTVSSTKSSKKKIIIGIVLGIIVIFLAIGIFSDSDESMGVADMVFGEMEKSMGQAVECSPFYDAKWSNDGSNIVSLYFIDANGIDYRLKFKLFDNNTRASIESATMDNDSLDNLQIDYLLEYLDSGDYEEFKSSLAAYAILAMIFS